MFQKALKMAQHYTLPVVASFLRQDGKTGSIIGTYIILNDEGWMLTAHHIVEQIEQMRTACENNRGAEEQISRITHDASLNRAQRRQELRRIRKPDKKAVVNCSVWWGVNNWRIDHFISDPLSDLAIGQLIGFDKRQITFYPEFKNPAVDFSVGESLCKLGFPLHNIVPIYEEEKGRFRLPKEATPVPLFPIEGIYTRTAVVLDENSSVSTEFVETSSPGLPGQSGGPIFDTKGRIWAIQSKTAHYSLGIPDPKKPTQEYQFHAGLGSHVNAIRRLLDSHNVGYVLSKD